MKKCDICHQEFTSERGVNIHKSRVHKEINREMDIKCSLCDKIFDTEKGLKIHNGHVHKACGKKTSYKCSSCDKTFDTDKELKSHQGQVHKVSEISKETESKCSLCDKTFGTDKGLKIHHGQVHKEYSLPKQKTKACQFKDLQHRDSLPLYEAVELDNKPVHNNEHLQIQQSHSRLQRKDISVISDYLNEFMDDFLLKLDELTPSLKWDSMNSGSYYEKTKTSKPDEFDIMLLPSAISVSVDFSDRSVPGFYKVKMISTRTPDLNDTVDKNGYVLPRPFKEFCFSLFDRAIGKMRKGRRVKKKEKSKNSPAYTIDYDPGAGITHLDIDLVPSFKVDGWPDVARRINPQWIQADDKVNDSMKSYDVVCKGCPEGNKEKDLLWRLSFAKTEKMLMTYANSNDETKFRKNAYKCLKLCIENVKAANPGEDFKWSSYNLKHFMFHQYDDWPRECSEKVVIQRNVVKQLIAQLSKSQPEITNYFIKNDNVIKHIPLKEIRLIIRGLNEELKNLG